MLHCNKIKLTFIVPAYNAEITIARTLNSILSQSVDRYCIIIVDDGSTDHTAEICREYADKNPECVRYIYQQNRGLGGARNTGMDMVQTEYVAFLDADDWITPGYIQTFYECVEHCRGELPEIIMTLPHIFDERNCSVIDWYDAGKFKRIFKHDGQIIDPAKHDEIYMMEVNQCRKILQMEFARRIHFRFEEKIKWEDVYPHFYLLANCHRCMGISAIGFFYRIGNEHQITASRGAGRLDILVVIRQLLCLIREENRKNITFGMMRVIVRFSIWNIRMTDMDTRQEMVVKLHMLYRDEIPRRYDRLLIRQSFRCMPKADVMQYLLFLIAIRGKMLHHLFDDYLWESILEKMVRKALHAGEKVK